MNFSIFLTTVLLLLIMTVESQLRFKRQYYMPYGGAGVYYGGSWPGYGYNAYNGGYNGYNYWG